MRYCVWDNDVAKLLGAYPTEAEALSLVRTLTAHNGANLIARADGVLATEDTASSRADADG